MKLFPAIDLYEGAAVRLLRGDYQQMTVYHPNPLEQAQKFRDAGAEYLHMVDLEGAKTGGTPNFEVVKSIVEKSGLKVEIGGGVRSMEVAEQYISCGVMRVILGTAALTDPTFLEEAVSRFGDKIAVGVDIQNGMVAIKGWTEVSKTPFLEFCKTLQQMGVSTVICTDISKDGMLSGTNLELYQTLNSQFSMNIIASGGVSTLDDIQKLKNLGMYGAILGKALYTGTLDLKEALLAAQ